MGLMRGRLPHRYAEGLDGTLVIETRAAAALAGALLGLDVVWDGAREGGLKVYCGQFHRN
jgi:hypothetical protein